MRTDPQWQEQPDVGHHLQNQSSQADIENRYVVISGVNSAIGDNANTLNITNVGELSLCWRRPEVIPDQFLRGSVGRKKELTELRPTIAGWGERCDWIVAAGTSAAVRSQAGIGKIVLAALYAHHYGTCYPAGGVLWVSIGPQQRVADDVMPVLQEMAKFAYDANAQANLLKIPSSRQKPCGRCSNAIQRSKQHAP